MPHPVEPIDITAPVRHLDVMPCGYADFPVWPMRHAVLAVVGILVRHQAAPPTGP
jgi:hypothetical protein